MPFLYYQQPYTESRKVEILLEQVTTNKGMMKKRQVWHGISHGFYVVEKGDESEDLILARGEQVGGSEIWLVGAFDKNMGHSIRKYLQSNILDKKFNESQIERKAIDTMKNSYLIIRETKEGGGRGEVGGFATALFMKGEKFVVSQLGGYRAVLSRDGMAIEIGKRRDKIKHWLLREMLNMTCFNGNNKRRQQSRKFIVTSQKVEPELEFIILASDGIWEVMSNQEAVDLIGHIEDAQSASEILAEEAMTRMSKSTISCIVVRFH